MTRLTLTTTDPAAARADAVVVGLAPGAGRQATPRLLPGAETLDAAFAGRLARLLADLGATGRAGEVTKLASLGATTAPVVLAVGLGQERPTARELRRAAAVATRALRGSGTVLLALPAAAPDLLEAEAEGALLGGYDFTEFRKISLAGRPAAARSVALYTGQARSRASTAAVARGRVIAEAVSLVRDLVNTPPGDLTPEQLAARARREGEAAGCAVEVLDEKALARRGYGGLIGVGAASAHPPRLVRISHRPARAARQIALVGKGITFDSGGLSLKPATAMESMKSDMAGAASVLGAVVAAARLQVPVSVTGWLACAENMPSGTATRPGDVLRIYGGTQVEVLNTDAEGRLVLADALVRAAEDGPDAMVDIATLTGSQIVALGNRVAALMANDDGLRDRVAAAAAAAGEDVWPMPLPGDLRERLDSSIADLTNVPPNGNRDAGMLVAGVFLSTFVPAGVPWAHLDIAGPSWHAGEAYGEVARGGTGFGVRTLLAAVESFR